MAHLASRLEATQRSASLRRFCAGGARPPFCVPTYEAMEEPCWDFIRLLVVGAGGIGCELLHLLALTGFSDITVIDMDTIELSNLNRQFLFRMGDIGKPKSEVAAAFVRSRCPGVNIRAIFGRIEEQSDAFYRDFDFVVLGVDSVPARLWMNQKLASLATWTADAKPPTTAAAKSTAGGESGSRPCYRITEAIPFIDTGTEGFSSTCRFFDLAKRHVCIQCQSFLYNRHTRAVPMCTLENIPRCAEHCVLYAKMKLWEQHRPKEDIDPDNAEHIRWVTAHAQKRKELFKIGGEDITEAFTLGVVKNVVPQIGSTNAIVAGQAVTELLKWLVGTAPVLDNYTFFNGAAEDGVASYLETFAQQDAWCPVCHPRPLLDVALSHSPEEVRRELAETAEGLVAPEQRVELLRGTLRLRLSPPQDAGGDAGREVVLLYGEGHPMRGAVPPVATVAEGLAQAGCEGALAQEADGVLVAVSVGEVSLPALLRS